MEGFFNEVLIEDYLAGTSTYDVNNPPQNPGTHTEMRDKLVQTCSAFTGFDRQKSVFEDDYNPMLELAQILAYDKKIIERVTMYAKEDMLLDALRTKVVDKKTRHDYLY